MWKMQLLDENHLFIKYTSEDVVTLRVTDPSQVPLASSGHLLLWGECSGGYKGVSWACEWVWDPRYFVLVGALDASDAESLCCLSFLKFHRFLLS